MYVRVHMFNFVCVREGGRERGRERGRKGEREGEREGGREGGREREREKVSTFSLSVSFSSCDLSLRRMVDTH